MCNLYDLDEHIPNLAKWAQAEYYKDLEWATAIGVRSTGVGIWNNSDGARELTAMQFAISPPGCKTPSDPKRPMNNARIESLDKWPWKLVAGRNRCIVPLTGFIEPCYWGPPAGKQVRFFSPQEKLLGVAGLYNAWRSPDGAQEMTTMAMIMRPACEFIMENGHQRQPLFIEPEGFAAWLEGPRSVDEVRGMLKRWAYEPEMDYTVYREMNDGWQRRQQAAQKKRDEELAAIADKGVLGV